MYYTILTIYSINLVTIFSIILTIYIIILIIDYIILAIDFMNLTIDYIVLITDYIILTIDSIILTIAFIILTDMIETPDEIILGLNHHILIIIFNDGILYLYAFVSGVQNAA